MLNISKKIYVGWGVHAKGVPEAEIIPYGESANEKRKISSFTARHGVIKDFDNTPLPGFTLHKSGRRSWSSTDITWLVIDPRGFSARISSQNLEEILQVTGVTECLIQQRCVWAREDTQTKMTLVPVTAEEYDIAVTNTKLIEDKVDLADVQIGDKVLLQNELEGIYLGSLSFYGRISGVDVDLKRLKPSAKVRKQIMEVEPGRYHTQVDIKILKVLEKTDTPMTKQEAAARINKEINAQNAIFIAHDKFPTSPGSISSVISSYRGTTKFVSADAIPKPKLKFRKVTKAEAQKAFDNLILDHDLGLVVGDGKGGYLLPEFPRYGTATQSNRFFALKAINFNPNATVEIIETEGYRDTRYSYHSKDNRKSYSIDNYTEFYIIERHVKNNKYE